MDKKDPFFGTGARKTIFPKHITGESINISKSECKTVDSKSMIGVRADPSFVTPNRQMTDKKAAIAAIKSHMALIIEEKNRLKKQLATNKRDAINYEQMKTKVENYRKDLAEREETLTVYNTVIEVSMLKGSKEDIDANTRKLRISNQQKVLLLEKLCRERKAREEHISKIDKKIDSETKLFDANLLSLPPDQMKEYNELCKENAELTIERDQLKSQIMKLQYTINMHQQHVVLNEKKRKRYNLLVKRHELLQRREETKKESKIKRSPKAERTHLLQIIKRDREELEKCQNQEKELKEEIECMRDRLIMLDSELQENNRDRLLKYQQLLKKQEDMQEFFSTYEQNKEEYTERLNNLRAQIVFALELDSANSVEGNLKEIEGAKNYQLNSNLSVDELKQEYKKLTTQMNLLTLTQEQDKQELEGLKQKQDIWEEEMKTFLDIDRVRDEMLDRKQNLEAEKESMEKIYQATKIAVTEANKRSHDIENELKGKQEYQEILKLEEILEDRKEENAKLKEEIESLQNTSDYEQYRSEALNLTDDILSKLKKKFIDKKKE